MSSDKYEVEQYIVAYLDILGMRDELRRLDLDPDVRMADRETIVDALKRTLGATETFFKFFDTFTSAMDVAPRASGMPDEHVRWSKSRVEKKQFGDTLLLYFSAKPSDAHSPTSALYSMFAASSLLSLFQLGLKSPIRGGIEVGAGVRLDDGTLYSSAVVKAIDLEKKAAYPRILVGNGVRRYIDYLLKKPMKSDRDRYDKKLVDAATSLIHHDQIEDVYMVDFLGKTVRDIGRKAAIGETIPRDVYDFVRDSREKFKNDSKLRPRYERLYEYLEKRRYLWTDFL